MNSPIEHPAEILAQNNIKPSHQRIRILEYLASHKNHPSAEQISNDLQQLMPTLAKSTVYSTLKVFTEAGLIREIKIGDSEARFDYFETPHGHFKCDTCGTIYDFELDVNQLSEKGLSGFRIDTKSVYFTGTCERCLHLEQMPE